MASVARAESSFFGWRLVAILWVLIVINGALPMYGLPVLLAYAADSAGLSHATTGSAYSCFMLMTGLPAPLIAILIEKRGVRFTLVLGSLLLLGCAATMAAFAPTPLLLILVAGLVAGTANAMGSVLPMVVALTCWFRRRRTLAIALSMSGLTIGGALWPPVLQAVVAAAHDDWRVGWLAMAACAGLAALLSALVIGRPDQLGQSAFGSDDAPLDPDRTARRKGAHVTSEAWTFSEALRRPSYWTLIAASIVALAALTLFLGQGIAHLRDLGYSIETAAYFTSGVVVVGLIAHLAIGIVSDRIDPQYLWAIGMGAQGIGLILFASTANLPLLILGVALLGAGTSAAMLCVLSLVANWYGAAAYPGLAGVASAGSTIGAASSFLGGWAYDAWGSALPVYYAIGACGIVSMIALFLLKAPSRAA